MGRRKKPKPCGTRKLQMRVAPSRDCGECEACCWALEVCEISLDKFVQCEYQRSLYETNGHGCRAYADRPRLCQQYRCEWLAGMLYHGIPPESLRPDKCGIIFHGMAKTVWGTILAATEAFPDGFDNPMAGYLLDSIRRQRLVLLIGPNLRKLTGPAKLVKTAEQQAKIAIERGLAAKNCDHPA